MKPSSEQQHLHVITILSVSAGMVGVCLTAIGLIGIFEALKETEVIVDDMLAVAALFFLTTTVLSFLGMRTRLSQVWQGFWRTLDILFCVALVLVFISAAVLTWALT